MNTKTSFRTSFATLLAAVAGLTGTSTSYAACITRTIGGTYKGTSWVAEKVCAQGEYAVSAGGFCKGNGVSMKGVSTTAGTTDRQVWLWCSQDGPAVWYAMCCTP
jgi:hypothetical protein